MRKLQIVCKAAPKLEPEPERDTACRQQLQNDASYDSGHDFATQHSFSSFSVRARQKR